jgi:hypothetical protein
MTDEDKNVAAERPAILRTLCPEARAAQTPPPEEVVRAVFEAGLQARAAALRASRPRRSFR